LEFNLEDCAQFDAQSVSKIQPTGEEETRESPSCKMPSLSTFHCSLIIRHGALLAFHSSLSFPSVKNKIKSIIKNTLGKNQYVKYRVLYSLEGNSGLEPDPPGGFARHPHPRTHLPFGCIH
jgi:hypothetical protein